VNPAPVIAVDADDRQGDRAIDVDTLETLLVNALRHCGVQAPAEVGLAFIDVEEMTELNQVHMGGTGPTDVLAFPIDGTDQAPDGQPSMIGDIVICPIVADRAPQELPDELALLVVHGALHLLGHDHAEQGEKAVMQAMERELLAAYHPTARNTEATGTA